MTAKSSKDSNIPKIIAISGGTCSGKSTFAKQSPDSVVVSTDDFYFDFVDMPVQDDGTVNWEHPGAADLNGCISVCQALANGEVVDIPIYETLTSRRIGYRRVKPPLNGVVIVEGVFAFEPQIAEIADILIFLDISMNVRRNRRLERDLLAGVALELVLKNLSNAEESELSQLEFFRKQAHVILNESDMRNYWSSQVKREQAHFLPVQIITSHA